MGGWVAPESGSAPKVGRRKRGQSVAALAPADYYLALIVVPLLFLPSPEFVCGDLNLFIEPPRSCQQLLGNLCAGIVKVDKVAASPVSIVSKTGFGA